MARTCHSELRLQEVEHDIFLGECLVGRIAALAAISSANGRTGQAREARKKLTMAAELLAPLYATRRRLRRRLAS